MLTVLIQLVLLYRSCVLCTIPFKTELVIELLHRPDESLLKMLCVSLLPQEVIAQSIIRIKVF